ncbi:MAG: putative resolvase [Parcubacteria group bacterium Athens0714_25]|nr:MAG: putative resolvase [Parcubacteria group bacterium Athens0714_25]
MQQVYGYIRVSTIRQGVQGVSLQEQKAAIEQYAQKNKLEIIEWFEERETAAKLGRPVFLRMLKNLRQKKTSGVIIHKIDRSARNLKDWAALGELLDSGIDVRFAHDSLDLHARGGRLSADIQAVIAADYIRNLREETKKGFYGRLKQGLYPMRAPFGYLDQGAGKAKIPDPTKTALIKEIFRLYATGDYSLDQLVAYLTEKGGTNREGGRLNRSGLARVLRNPFYVGLIYIQRTGETFPGIHEPMISKSLFDDVQDILDGKKKKGPGRHDFLFRRMFTCQVCNRTYIGEKQKGLNYYRCHICKGSCVREEVFAQELRNTFRPILLCPDEIEQVSLLIDTMKESSQTANESKKQEILLRQKRCKTRLDRLIDAYVDNVIEKETYLQRKESVLREMKGIEEEMITIDNQDDFISLRVTEKLELLKSLYLSFKSGTNGEKRDFIKKLTSNRQIDGKNVAIELKTPFKELSEYITTIQGARGGTRTRTVFLPRDFKSLVDTNFTTRAKINKRGPSRN